MTDAILQVSDLSVYYNKKKALNSVSLSFQPKEITALIGPSGSGKSTLLKSLNRMGDLNPEVTTTGSVVYNGHNIYSPRTDTVELRKEIGMVFQQPNPFPMTIYENVVYGLRINGIKDKQVLDEAVEKPCKVPLSGMRSRIVYMIQLLDCQVVNSSVSAWPVSWQLVLKSSSWMSQLRLWIRFQLVKLRKPCMV